MPEHELKFTEYGIKDGPGWDRVKEFVSGLIFELLPFQCRVLRQHGKGDPYVIALSLDGLTNCRQIVPSIDDALRCAAFVALILPKAIDLDDLLKYYSRDSAGMLKADDATSLFSAQLDCQLFEGLTRTERLLLINHDGDPVFLLERVDIPPGRCQT